LILAAYYIPEKHDGAEILEPVGAKCGNAESVEKGVRITLFDFEVELRA
jgi:hypothetical protein